MTDKETIAKLVEPFFGRPVEVHTDIIITDNDGAELGTLEDAGTDYQVRVDGEFKGYIEKPLELIINKRS